MNFRLAVILFVGLAAMLVSTTAASAWWWRDRTPPTQPGNLQVTDSGTDYVALAWDASFDWSFNFSYRIYRDGHSPPVAVSGSQTSYVWGDLEPGMSYSFRIDAIDAAGNVSAPSNTVEAITSPADEPPPPEPPAEVEDTTPPSAPTSLYVAADVGCGNFFLDWTESRDNVDAQSFIRYDVYMDDGQSPVGSITGDYFIELHVDIEPNSTHTFFLRAVDRSGNESAPSNVFEETDICP